MKLSAVAILRVLSVLLIIGTAAAYGYLHRSPLCIPSLGLVFTVLYAIGKWQAWQMAWTQGGPVQIMRAVLITYPIQCIVVGIIYLIGYGLGSLLSPGREVVNYNPADSLYALGLLLLGGLLGIAINLLERRDTKTSAEYPNDEDADELDIDPTPLTLDNFFISHYHAHKHTENVGLSEQAYATHEMIAETEARLGIKFPALLRALYERQNGGHVGWLFVPRSEMPRPLYSDWRGVFSIDYCDLLPLDELQTLRDSYLDFADEDDEEIPENASQLIVLSQRYLDTTYLDYSAPGEPKVGVKDFDEYTSEQGVEFENFEEFFGALRRMSNEK